MRGREKPRRISVWQTVLVFFLTVSSIFYCEVYPVETYGLFLPLRQYMCVPRKGYAREGPRHAVPSAWDSPSNRGMVRVGCTRRALRVGPLDGRVSAWEIWCVLYNESHIRFRGAFFSSGKKSFQERSQRRMIDDADLPINGRRFFPASVRGGRRSSGATFREWPREGPGSLWMRRTSVR